MSATQTQITIPSDILTTGELYGFLRENPRNELSWGKDVLQEDYQALTANIEARLAEMEENLDEVALTQIMIQLNASARQGTPCRSPKRVLPMIEKIAFSGWWCVTKEGFRRTKKSTLSSPWFGEFTLADGRVWGTEATYNRVMDSELYLVALTILKEGGPIKAEPSFRETQGRHWFGSDQPSSDRVWSPNAKLSNKIEKEISKSFIRAKQLVHQARQAEEAQLAYEMKRTKTVGGGKAEGTSLILNDKIVGEFFISFAYTDEEVKERNDPAKLVVGSLVRLPLSDLFFYLPARGTVETEQLNRITRDIEEALLSGEVPEDATLCNVGDLPQGIDGSEAVEWIIHEKFSLDSRLVDGHSDLFGPHLPPVAETAPETLSVDEGVQTFDDLPSDDRLHFEDIRRETITMILGQAVRVVEYIFPSSQIKNGQVREFFVLEGAKVGHSTQVLLTEALSAHPSFIKASLKTTSEGGQVLMIVSKALPEFLGMKRHEKLQTETAPETPAPVAETAPEIEALIEETAPAVSIPEGVKVQFHRADLKGLIFTTEGLEEGDIQGLFYETPFERESGILANWSVSRVRPLVSEDFVPCLPLVFDWRLSAIGSEDRVKAEDLLETFLDRFELQFGFRPAVELPSEEDLVLAPETIKLFVPIKPSYDENLVRHLFRRVRGVSQAVSASVRSKVGFKGGNLFTGFDIEVPFGTDLEGLKTDLAGLTRRASAPITEEAPETPKLWSEEEALEGDTHQAHLDGVLVFSDDLSKDEIEGDEVVLIEIHEGGFVKSHGLFESESTASDLLEVWEESIRDSKGSVFKILPLAPITH